MSKVAAFDLSTHAVDIVCLDEDSNAAEWTRVELGGKTAWERTLGLAERMPPASWYDDRGVYLAAVEAPYGRGQGGTNAVLNRVVGAVVASLPAALRVPERCWIVAPHEYRAALGLRAKPTAADIDRIAPGATWTDISGPTLDTETWQNAYDAFALAYWARETNAQAVAQTLEAAT